MLYACFFFFFFFSSLDKFSIDSFVFFIDYFLTVFTMASRAKAKPPKKRQQRATSNIFAMFDQSQIQEYKEAFNIIDHDRVKSISIDRISSKICF